MVDATVADGWLDWSLSDAAQQLSASAWLTVWVELGASDLRIGHAPPSEQQAMRASGVGSQPAHRATLLAERARVKTATVKRLLTITTA